MADGDLLPAFMPLSAPGDHGMDPSGDRAFSRSWIRYERVQDCLALSGRAAFFQLYEYFRCGKPWQRRLHCTRCGLERTAFSWSDNERRCIWSERCDSGLHSPHDHDRHARRVTLQECVAIVGEDVTDNLEGLALARSVRSSANIVTTPRFSKVSLRTFLAVARQTNMTVTLKPLTLGHAHARDIC